MAQFDPVLVQLVQEELGVHPAMITPILEHRSKAAPCEPAQEVMLRNNSEIVAMLLARLDRALKAEAALIRTDADKSDEPPTAISDECWHLVLRALLKRSNNQEQCDQKIATLLSVHPSSVTRLYGNGVFRSRSSLEAALATLQEVYLALTTLRMYYELGNSYDQFDDEDSE